jgi:hypothetical protein
MIQTPKAAIPAEIKNESALSICVPLEGLLPQDRRAKGARCFSVCSLIANGTTARPAKPGRQRDACFPSTKFTSTPFLTDFANRSTSQFVILTQPCDSDLLTRDG